MASRLLSTHPTSLDDLPFELRDTLTQYLGEKDLGTMRLLSSDWNATAKTTLRRRKRLAFSFGNVAKLVQFNDTFAKYSPTEDIAAGLFCFKLAALDTVAAKEHLDTFVQKFGHLVTSLSVNLVTERKFSGWTIEDFRGWFASSQKCETVLDHVTLLLDKVRGQVRDLELLTYAGLQPRVIGREPFPRLQTLTVGHSPRELASLGHAALEEACILRLCRRVPAIQRFEFKAFRGSNGGEPTFLVNVLRNLTRVNPQVEVKLDMVIRLFQEEEDDDDDSALLHELLKETVRIVELDLDVYGDLENLPKTLRWMGAQSNWLKKLTFRAEFHDTEAPLAGLKLPSLRALEELSYVQKTVESLLQYDTPDYFPNLRKVTTAATGNDFTVTLPQVTDLTLCRNWLTGIAARNLGNYGQALFQLPPFPNLETLTCPVKFIDLESIVKLKNLRRLILTPDLKSNNIDSFWKRTTHGALKLTLEQIRALPEPSEDEVRQRAEPCFSDLTNLQELKMVVYNSESVNFVALLFLSKTKRLQRLRKLELEVDSEFESVPDMYLDELRKYHNSVLESDSNSLYSTTSLNFV